MSSIQIEDHVRVALERAAGAMGLSLSEYLAQVAASASVSEPAELPSQRSLAELLAPIIAEAQGNGPQPRTAPIDTMKSEFDAAMVEKYRKQEFNL